MKGWQDLSDSNSRRNCHSWIGPLPEGIGGGLCFSRFEIQHGFSHPTETRSVRSGSGLGVEVKVTLGAGENPGGLPPRLLLLKKGPLGP